MKNKFKVGDKVRIKTDNSFFDKGETVRVVGYDESDNTYKCEFLDGSNYWWVYEDNITPLIPSLTITIKPVTRKGGTYYRPQYKHKNGEIMNDLYSSKSNAKRGTNKFLDAIKNEDYEIVIK